MSFDDDISLRPAGPGAFDLEVPEHWRVARGATNGGYIAAVMTRALEASIADPVRGPRSLTVHYLAACRPGPAQVTVAVERSGRSLTTLTARLSQDGAIVAIALGALAGDRPGLDFQHEPMPEAPPPEDLAPGWPVAGRPPHFTTNWDYRPCVGAVPLSGADRALTGGWLRPAQPRPLDAPLLAAMADAWLPPALLLDKTAGILPTIDLTVHFRAALPPNGAAPDDFCLAVFESRVGAHGFWEGSGVIWSRNGLVLAQARQLALFGG